MRRHAKAVFVLAMLCSFFALAATASAACPNEEIRIEQGATGLPECRAFELVSPPQKGGNAVESFGTTQSSPGGEAVAFASNGGFAGSQTSTLGGYYVARRSSSGWATTGVDAPQSNQGPQLVRTTTFLDDELSKAIQVSSRALTPGAAEGGGNLYWQNLLTGERQLALGVPGTTGVNGLIGVLGAVSGRPIVGASAGLGSFVFSADGPLVPGAAPGTRNAYEAIGGTVRLVNVLPDGSVDPNGGVIGSYTDREFAPRPISDDGRKIVFRSPPVGGGLFMRIDGSSTIPLMRTGEGDVPAEFMGASADGEVVYAMAMTFSSFGPPGLYRIDVGNGAVSFQANALSVDWVSRDGATVLFTSHAALTEDAVEYNTNLYVSRNGQTRLIGVLDSTYEMAGPGSFAVSGDESWFSFTSSASPTGYDNADPECNPGGGVSAPPGKCMEVFMYNLQTNELRCATCNADAENRHSFLAYRTKLRLISEYMPSGAMNDGSLFFTSAERLVPEDINNSSDVYEWSWQDGTTRLISSGRGAKDARLQDVSEDGGNVFFTTADRLVGSDVDQAMDLYVARVDGGLASQGGVRSSASCSGEECQLVPPATRGPSSGGRTASYVGGGNLPTATRGRGARVRVARPGPVAGPAAKLRVTVASDGLIRVLASAWSKPSSLRADGPGTHVLKLSLSARGRDRLREEGRLTVRPTVRFASSSGRQVARTQVTFEAIKREGNR